MQMTWVVVIIKMDSKSFEKSKKRAWNFYFYYFCHMKMNSKIQRKNRLGESLGIFITLYKARRVYLGRLFFFNFWQTKNLKMTKSYPYCEGNFLNPLILKFSNWSLFYTSSFTLDFFFITAYTFFLGFYYCLAHQRTRSVTPIHLLLIFDILLLNLTFFLFWNA